MCDYLPLLLIYFSCYLLIQCPVVQTRKLKPSPIICVENQIQIYSINHLKLCYTNHPEDRLTFVWFSVGKSLNDTFDLYRFTFRMHESSIESRSTIKLLTNFTELIDANNSLRMYNLDTGQYEVCIEFHSETPVFIYQPRDGCITIDIGRSQIKTFAHDSTQMLVALACGIVIFFVLGLVVQWTKDRRQKRLSEETDQPRSLSSRILSTKSLKQQRDRLVKNLFQQQLDEPQVSRIRQWARDQASRHRASTHELDLDRARFLEKRNKRLFSSSTFARQSLPTSESILFPKKLSIVSEESFKPIRSSSKVSFLLSPAEESEMTSRF